MKGLFTFFVLFQFCAGNSSFAYTHEIVQGLSGPTGFQEAWVKLTPTDATGKAVGGSVEVSLPYCLAKSVKKLNQYCLTGSGTVGYVTSISPGKVTYGKIDLDAEGAFEKFSARVAPIAGRMPASETAKEISCEAACPELDLTTKCKASGSSQALAIGNLKAFIADPVNSQCAKCNVKTVVCDGQLIKPGP